MGHAFERSGAVVLLVALTATPALAEKRRAFITSATGNGNISGWFGVTGDTVLDKADSVCRTGALSGNLPNPNAYRAWLSTSITDAYCHVQGLTGKKSAHCGQAVLPSDGGPWFREDGVGHFSGSLAKLTDEYEVYRPLSTTEHGVEVANLPVNTVWTGTLSDGTAHSFTCDDWGQGNFVFFGSRGATFSTGTGWTSHDYALCDSTARLVCLESGAGESDPPRWTPGSIVFASSESGNGDLEFWPSAGGQSGLAAGDSVCRTLAAGAHLPDPTSFLAWLSTSSVDAESRLDSDGPFLRVDGYPIAASKSALLDGALDNGINVEQTGAYTNDLSVVWTGTSSAGSSTGQTCGDWDSGGANGQAGVSTTAFGPEWTDAEVKNCGIPGIRLLCFSPTVTIFYDGFERTGDTSWWSQVSGPP